MAKTLIQTVVKQLQQERARLEALAKKNPPLTPNELARERLNAERGVAVVLVTHDHEIAARARRQVYFRDGLIERDTGAVVA